MSSELLHPVPDSADIAWRELDGVLDEIAQLVRSEQSPTKFHAECLRRVVTGLGAAGGIVWLRGPAAQLRADSCLLPSDGSEDEGQVLAAHAQLAAGVLEDKQSKVLPPGVATVGTVRLTNPLRFLLLASPWDAGNEIAGVLEILRLPGAGPKTQEVCLAFLEAVCELVADFHRRRQLGNYRLWSEDLKRIQDFAQQVHRSLNLKDTAFTVANEGRRLIGCDRVSVLVRRGTRCRLVAVSGVATVHRRANAVRALERLASGMLAAEEPLWHPERKAERAPQLERLLDTYLDESHARGLAVLPLRLPPLEADADSPPALGVLVVERFSGTLDEPSRWNATAVSAHGALALGHALELDRVPFLGLLCAIGRGGWFPQGRQRVGAVLVSALVVLGAVALTWLQTDFGIEARGELQPVGIRDVFAPADGVVGELRVRHGQQVAGGEILAVLRRSELDLEFKRVWGELQTVRKRLASIEAERIQGRREADDQRLRYGQLTAQQEEVREQIAGLESQYAILEQQQAELEIRSPTDGEVLTWNPQQLLDARPVARGQILMTVGDLRGPWHLELRIPDRRVAHVLAARRSQGDDLKVSFILANDPGRWLTGTLDRVGLRTEISETDGVFVLSTVTVQREQIPQLMPGAGVTAKIHCGRRAVGYVWFHDLIDTVRTWLLL